MTDSRRRQAAEEQPCHITTKASTSRRKCRLLLPQSRYPEGWSGVVVVQKGKIPRECTCPPKCEDERVGVDFGGCCCCGSGGGTTTTTWRRFASKRKPMSTSSCPIFYTLENGQRTSISSGVRFLSLVYILSFGVVLLSLATTTAATTTATATTRQPTDIKSTTTSRLVTSSSPSPWCKKQCTARLCPKPLVRNFRSSSFHEHSAAFHAAVLGIRGGDSKNNEEEEEEQVVEETTTDTNVDENDENENTGERENSNAALGLSRQRKKRRHRRHRHSNHHQSQENSVGKAKSTEEKSHSSSTTTSTAPSKTSLVVETTTTLVLDGDDDDNEEKVEGHEETPSISTNLVSGIPSNARRQQQQQQGNEPEPQTMAPDLVDLSSDETDESNTSDSDDADAADAAKNNNGENNENTSVHEALFSNMMNQEIIREQASLLRLQGKELHDQGNFDAAAATFSKAASLLLPTIRTTASTIDLAAKQELVEEFATCRLHEALCRLKAEDYEAAVAACTDVVDLPTTTSSTLSTTSATTSSSELVVAPALRARAFHRRAKAQLELGNTAIALQDARSAAFLGDRKAVALYGKLMRESPGVTSNHNHNNNNYNDYAGAGSLFESLLGKSSESSPLSSSSSSGMPSNGNFLPMSLLNSLGPQANGGAAGAGGMAGLAKSVLQSLFQRMDDETTLETICQYLHGTSGPQLQTLSTLAGIPLPAGQAAKIAAACHGITPRTIRKTVTITKRVVYCVQLIRKVLQLCRKYRHVLIFLLLLAWTKSALLRPMPINKRAARQALQAAAAAAAAATTATTTAVATP